MLFAGGCNFRIYIFFNCLLSLGSQLAIFLLTHSANFNLADCFVWSQIKILIEHWWPHLKSVRIYLCNDYKYDKNENKFGRL